MSEVIIFLKACEAWDCVKVKDYLEKGGDVNAKHDGNFALKYAAECPSGIQLLEVLLLSPNLDVNNTDSDGKTAFMWSCFNGSLEVVERILTVPGVDLNHEDKEGNTAFMLACLNGRKAIVDRMLTVPGVDLNHQDELGMTAFMLSCINEKKDLVEKMLTVPRVDFNHCDKEGNTAFMLACFYGSKEIVERMLTVPGVDLNHQDKQGNTAFMLSCLSGKKEIVDLLLENPLIDTNEVNENGTTAFMLSCQNGWKQIVEKLLETSKVDINLYDYEGRNALMMAWEEGYGSEDIVVMILAAKRLNIMGNEKYIQRMLLWSCDQGRVEVTRLLLAIPNIDVNICDINGRTPLHYLFTPLDNYIMLLDVHGIVINARDVGGFTVLMYAVLCCNSMIIKLLAENDKVDINIKNNQGLDVFTLALMKEYVSAIKILLNVPNLKPDVELLMRKKIYEKAVTHCHQYVVDKIISSDVSYSIEPFNPCWDLYALAYANGMKNIATVFIPDHDTAVENCRSLVAEVMDDDKNLNPEANMTELVYALRKGMENLALVLASRVKTSDILLMCQIFHVEQEKERLAAEAQE